MTFIKIDFGSISAAISGVAGGGPLGNRPMTQKLLPKDFLKCYQLPNAEKSCYTCMFEDPSGVIVT